MNNEIPKEEMNIPNELGEEKLKERFESIPEKRLKMIENIVLAAVLVLAVGFITMFVAFGTLIWNAHIWSADIYREFIDKLNESNAKSELFLEKIKSLESYGTATSTGAILRTSP